jgi:hypothetical protein
MRKIKDLTFYHGTNTVFINSIEKHGLGGYDIVKESQGIELLYHLNDIAETRVTKEYMDAGRGMLRIAVCGILLQTPDDYINWQHGDVYITPNLNRALAYTINNRFGSELFTHIYLVNNFLTQLEIHEAKEIINNYPIVKEIISKKGDPIVIEITNLDESSLLTEGGEDPKRVLIEYLEFLKASPVDGSLLQELNSNNLGQENEYLKEIGFRLNKIINYDQLLIHPVKNQ